METETPKSSLTLARRRVTITVSIRTASPSGAAQQSRRNKSPQPLPHLPSTSPALSLGIRHRLPITRNTLPVANRIIHIIERQIPLLGTIPPLDRRTPARLTLVLQHLVRQRPDLRQRQIRAGLQIIRERAHAPVADAEVELVVPAGAVAVGAAGHVGADT